MPKFVFTAPDGNKYTVNGPDGATPEQAFEILKTQIGGTAQPSMLGPEGPRQSPQQNTDQPISAGDVAADIAKSTGIGLARGAIGLAGLPGNVELLGRLGIDKAATALGYEDPKLSTTTAIPTSGDIQAGVEGYTGKFYEPKTVAGEYARTIGEFAPMALGGAGGVGSRLSSVLAPAITSETAGQLTKGTEWEPWARAAGAIGGNFLPNAAMRVATPLTNAPARQQAVQTLQNEGVDALTAGQMTGNRAVRWAESAAQDLPFNGGRGAQMMEQQAEQFTRAALRRGGINADRATPDVLDNAFQQIGQEYQTWGQGINIQPSARFNNGMRRVAIEYSRLTPDATRVPLVEQLANELPRAIQNGMTPQQYLAFRSEIQMARRGLKNDPHASNALGDIVQEFDAAVIRSAPYAQRQQLQHELQDMNTRYRNLLAIEDAAAAGGEAAATGLISPAALRNAVKKQSKRDYTRGRTELADLARAGTTVMSPLPNSGTPARLAFQNLINAAGAVVGGSVAGGPGAAVGIIAPALGQGMAGRALMSAPMQNYLSNQRLAPLIEQYAAQRPNALMALPQALSAAETGLRGGIGPRYDENGNLR